MTFETYAERIMELKEYTEQDKKPKRFFQRRFHAKNTNMQIVTIKKSKFAGLIDKRFYFSDGICSLPYGHPLLKNVSTFTVNFSKLNMVFYQKKVRPQTGTKEYAFYNQY